ncbi:hypothetical protein ACFQ9X_40685 [Catenulispora yoronensis]
MLSLSVRQVRRWESEDPPCPLPAYQRVLEEVFGVSVAQMGFQVGWTVPWAPRPESSQPPTAVTGRAPEPEPEDGGGAGEPRNTDGWQGCAARGPPTDLEGTTQ